MDTIDTVVLVFVILCVITLFAGVIGAIYYDTHNPDWYKPKEKPNARKKWKKVRRTPDA